MGDRVLEQTTPVTSTISPKVKAGTIAGSGIAIFLTAFSLVLTMVTPDMFADLGPYAILISTFLTALGAGIAAYLKQDPDRISQSTIQAYAEEQVKLAIKEYEDADKRRKEQAKKDKEQAEAVAAATASATPVPVEPAPEVEAETKTETDVVAPSGQYIDDDSAVG